MSVLRSKRLRHFSVIIRTIRLAITLGVAGFGAAFVQAAEDVPSEPDIMTVNGPLPADQMGSTLTHEHLFSISGAAPQEHTRYSEPAVLAATLPALRELKEQQVNPPLKRDDRVVWTRPRSLAIDLPRGRSQYRHEHRLLWGHSRQIPAAKPRRTIRGKSRGALDSRMDRRHR